MIRFILALILALTLPATAIADDHHNGDQRGGSSHASGAPPQYRQAPAQHYSAPRQGGYSAPQQREYAPEQRQYSAPQQRVYSAPSQRWDTSQQRDYTPQQRSYTSQQRDYTSPQRDYTSPQRNYTSPERNYTSSQRNYTSPQQGYTTSREGYTGRGSGSGFSGRSYASGPFSARQFSGAVIGNPQRWGGWGWNHGVAWFPLGSYWGGGFWGPWGLDTLAAAALFGAIVDYQDQAIYPSFAVAPQSPGAELLQNYGLQQTECGPPGLVTIWGPNNSVICAYPNNLVSPGNYELDPETLTITSDSNNSN